MIQWNFQGINVYLYDNGKEQLQFQNSRYQGRTWFNTSGLPEGDASLVLSNIGISDEGNYTCFVKNSQDRGEGEVELLVVVPYGKVTVTCLLPCQHLSSLDDNVTLLCQSWGGYPRPHVMWSISGISAPESMENITETHDRTFSVQSLLVIRTQLILQAECTLKNQRAKEDLRAQYSSDNVTTGAHKNQKLICVTCDKDELKLMAHKGIIPSLVLIGCLLGFFLVLLLGCK
nr:CD276 antigen-like isoform X2 [Geotrypetes seraphini]